MTLRALIEGEFPKPRTPAETYESSLRSRGTVLGAVRRVGLLARDTTPVRVESMRSAEALVSRPISTSRQTVEARYEGED